MDTLQKDREILRRLGAEFRTYAELPVQRENIRLWKALNALKPERPLVLIDQLPWEELNGSGELDLQCELPDCRRVEEELRRQLYQWKHFPCDMVLRPYVSVPKVFSSTGYGITSRTEDDGRSGAETHVFQDNIPDEAALEALKTPVITYDEKATLAALERMAYIFEDVLPVRLTGSYVFMNLWDELVFLRGLTPCLMDLVDRPEFIHQMMDKFVGFKHSMLDQFEALNLLDKDIPEMNCSATYTDELPQEGYDPSHVRPSDCWTGGMAQLFSSCSPAMLDEFEIEHVKSVYDRAGMAYYGCCEPLHNCIGYIRKMKTVRKISVSPWADAETAAKNIGPDFVLSRKPNPSFLAMEALAEDAVREEVLHTLRVCKENATPVEFILKDITTVKHQPERLTRWYEIVKETIEDFR